MLAYLDVPEPLQRRLQVAFERVWSGPQVALSADQDGDAPRVAIVSHDDVALAWKAVEAFDRRHPFVPLLAVVNGAPDLRNRRAHPPRVDWVADFKELEDWRLRMALRLARERAHRRELVHRLDERHVEDLSWIVREFSHEIRDPLQSLTANLEWAEAQIGKLLQQGQTTEVEKLQEALRDSRTGLALVSRIAEDLTRSSRPVRVGRVELREVFDTIRRMTRKSLGNVKLTIRQGHGTTVLANETRLCQVFLNLVRNAAQALEGCEKPRIAIEVNPPAQGRVTVTVRDNGPGIPQSVVDNLFTPWVTTKETGTGLGLPVSRRYVVEMGGSLELSRTDDSGTEFTIELEATSGGLTRPTLVPDPSVIHARILVVDDTELVLRSMERALKEQHEVVTTANVEDAIEELRSSSFDLAIVDLQLPGRSGLDLYEIVMSEPRLSVPRFLFLSGDFSDEATSFLESRGLAWIRKPVGALRLNELVVETLQAKSPAERAALASEEAKRNSSLP